MVNAISWIFTLSLCLIVISRAGNLPGMLVAGYCVLALLLRWWIMRRITAVNLQNQHNARVFSLTQKYGDARIVEAIIQGKIWKGATSEMLRDSWGPPDDLKRGGDEDTWCYGRVGTNRYRHRVIVKAQAVKTWTNKN
ncbi:hypothetical protein [Bordetella pseudohinzii]|uniref:hypothetical protein n=1 Tax=Bordetella pseudohinzii TaxID=1331258 RepID=UPI00104092B2|nr:hypothetical protein [Bordetella pseudohinzii]